MHIENERPRPRLRIAYQPIVELQDARVVGFEALARLPSGISPEEAFETAWANGRGLELEIQAMSRAILDFPHAAGEAYLAVNVDHRALHMVPELLDTIRGAVPTQRLVIELSERSVVKDFIRLHQPLSALRKANVRIALDDVGSGYSGLSTIAQLLPDVLKLDRSLVQGLDATPVGRAIVTAIVSLARELRTIVVAEGVETERERDWLVELGVGHAQGFLFGHPEIAPEAASTRSPGAVTLAETVPADPGAA